MLEFWEDPNFRIALLIVSGLVLFVLLSITIHNIILSHTKHKRRILITPPPKDEKKEQK